jgi:hypothetical protein
MLLFFILVILLFILYKKYYYHFTTIQPILNITGKYSKLQIEYSIKITPTTIFPSRKCYMIQTLLLTKNNLVKIMNILNISQKPQQHILDTFTNIKPYFPIELGFTYNKIYVNYLYSNHSIIHSVQYNNNSYHSRTYYHHNKLVHHRLLPNIKQLPINSIYYKFTTKDNTTNYTNMNVGIVPTPFYKIKHILQQNTSLPLDKYIPNKVYICWIALSNDHYTIYFRHL